MRTSTLILGIALAVSSIASPVKVDLGDGVEYEIGYPVMAAQVGDPEVVHIPKRATTFTSTKTTSTRKASSFKTTSTAKASPIATKLATTSSKVSSTSKTSSTQKSSAAPAKATTYQQRVLVSHNVHRANHSASNLIWDNALASTAAKIASTCVYAHNTTTDGGGYGQNIAAGVTADNITAIITELFYNNEVSHFNGLYGQAQPDMSNFGSWGHFSQIVWKGTSKVGCATQYCPKGLANVGPYTPPYFTVCNYLGEFADNVGSMKSEQVTIEQDLGSTTASGRNQASGQDACTTRKQSPLDY
ncbi:PR-1-like protein [Aureobasidium subglaciale]|nr:PR-1-like protein [Aureobasidium subglaciale]